MDTLSGIVLHTFFSLHSSDALSVREDVLSFEAFKATPIGSYSPEKVKEAIQSLVLSRHLNRYRGVEPGTYVLVPNPRKQP